MLVFWSVYSWFALWTELWNLLIWTLNRTLEHWVFSQRVGAKTFFSADSLLTAWQHYDSMLTAKGPGVHPLERLIYCHCVACNHLEQMVHCVCSGSLVWAFQRKLSLLLNSTYNVHKVTWLYSAIRLHFGDMPWTNLRGRFERMISNV